METTSINKFLLLFNQLSKPEQLEVVDKINRQTFEERWQSIDRELPDTKFSEEDIMKEVQAVRYGDKKN